MYSSQAPYRELYEAIQKYDGKNIFAEMLSPWLLQNDEERGFLGNFATRVGEPWPLATSEELCRLYAASRVNELLVLRFQPTDDAHLEWNGPVLLLEEYIQFF